ncbi:Glyoxalase/bleomycin resistance protein/dioxygenase [Pseudonocardia dioxanivorans CB1190]|uniref:Glyoxalase/bleomycin resistance protein/dioxygenase n=1 Tax=Pseudonocardia dioxanivorans (strain ATCC 55486 / DSM 44775 / JCM 13855 / CB1190) TaxID=675635 RepID=F4CP70_PSEUX|nr:VOC family protein [Pseudonocardia dioxanivorans]AEA23629.1 Glyoxalase/bleomycin resistance protein/dioxygenase [Pseudonocardia dioxanivorans CB1190]
MIDVRGVHHLGLTVGDLATASAFYASAGYQPADRISLTGPDGAVGNGLDAASLEIAFLIGPTLTLELVEFDPPAPRRVSATDPGFGSVPIGRPGAGQDPDGRPVTFGTAERGLFLTSAAPERTVRLLDALGFDRDGDGAVAGHGVHVDVVGVAAPGRTPANAPGRVHLCCEVADMQKACDELAAAGFDLVSAPRVSGHLSWVFVAHPEGPGVELLEIGTP